MVQPANRRLATEAFAASVAGASRPASSISDLTEVVEDLVAALFAAGAHTGITFTYNDAGRAISATVTGAGGVDAETVRDIVGATVRGTAPITATFSDAGDTTTIAVTIGTAANTVAAGNDARFSGYASVTTRTSGFTVAATDAGGLHIVTAASGVTVTAPTPTSLGLPPGQVVHIAQAGTGAVTVTNGAGATVSNRYGSFVSSGQHATLELVATSGTGWLLRGEVA